jgi:hypothetical protein
MAQLWSVSQQMVTKIAARRGLQMIRQLVQSGGAGDLAKANRLAMRPGVLKPSAAGSQIKDLGMGGEGLATMVADPKRGLSVRKLYDPEGIASKQMIQRKHIAGKNLTGEQSIAQYKGQAPTPQGGGTMQFSEYVPGNVPNSFQVESTRQQATQAISSRTPYTQPVDIRGANMIAHPKSGKTKVIDFMPTAQGEVAQFAQGTGSHQIGLTPQGHSLINENSRDFVLGHQEGLLPKDTKALQSQQGAHLKQTFLGRGQPTTPAVTRGQQNQLANSNIAARRAVMPPSPSMARQSGAGTQMAKKRPNQAAHEAATRMATPKNMKPAVSM